MIDNLMGKLSPSDELWLTLNSLPPGVLAFVVCGGLIFELSRLFFKMPSMLS